MRPRKKARISRSLGGPRWGGRVLHDLAMVGVLLMLAAGCSRKQNPQPQQETIPQLEHADSSAPKPNNFLHKTFLLKKYVQFSFEVPPHALIPRLHGTFHAFIPHPGEEPVRAEVEFILLNAEQHEDFTHGHGEGTALYSIEPTHSQEVDFALPPSHEAAETYYVVFRNAAGAEATSVEADFTVSFGY